MSNGSDTLRKAFKNKFRRYPDRDDSRYINGMIYPAINPGFVIAEGSTVFTIGSCFARNVEDALVSAGVEVPTMQFSAPQSEAPGRVNRILNQYNPGSMLQAVEAINAESHSHALNEGKLGVVDLLLATGSRPVSIERALERRGQIRDLYERGLESADTVLITLGLVECWRDDETGLWLNEVPADKIRAGDTRYSFHRLDVAQSTDLIAQMVEALGTKNIVLTVSPVPLQATFSDYDCTVANAYSKATLRLCADRIASDFPNVDYFPSYEMVTLMGLPAFGVDNVHVSNSVVGNVIAHMVSHYVHRGIAEAVA
ncbi:MAG: GSCFA domain-containing protein [Aurantimonas endophytica]|uniref:GSCFA domain-containing protein n=1 Tax=Aurantimonas endophytica TaxID=1522175 RepID=UPI00300383BC